MRDLVGSFQGSRALLHNAWVYGQAGSQRERDRGEKRRMLTLEGGERDTQMLKTRPQRGLTNSPADHRSVIYESVG